VDNDGTRVDAVVGEPFEVRLEEPATSGFVWTVEAVAPGLEIVGSDFQPPTRGIGGNGVRTLRLCANDPGSYSFELALRRPWESSPHERRSYRINVH
jgi:predicted secreted protein